jgi:DNA primase
VARIEGELESDDARRILSVAAVQPLQSRDESTDRVVAVTILQLQARTLARHIADLKSKLQRANPAEQAELHNEMFGELIALEQQHRSLRDRITAD